MQSKIKQELIKLLKIAEKQEKFIKDVLNITRGISPNFCDIHFELKWKDEIKDLYGCSIIAKKNNKRILVSFLKYNGNNIKIESKLRKDLKSYLENNDYPFETDDLIRTNHYGIMGDLYKINYE